MPLRSKRIGVIGGGQLGLKLAEAASPWKQPLNILDKSHDCPAGPLAHIFVPGALTDAQAILELAAISDVLTYEIEHINTNVLIELEAQGKPVIPSPKVLEIIKDKGKQKDFFRKHQIPTSPYYIASNQAELLQGLDQLKPYRKFAGKSCTGGYDGKGVHIFEAAFAAEPMPLDFPVMVEGFVQCEKELSVIVARTAQGLTATYPVVEMCFDPVANLVDYLICPSELSEALQKQAEQIAVETVTALQGVGIFAVEMFLDTAQKLYVNEIAPRPHNSGHHTIEACYTSQYEQLLRILLDLPLGRTDLIKPAVMYNILGPDDFSGPYEIAEPEKLLAMDGVYLHLYGKAESQPKRKLGHITLLADTMAQALDKLQYVREHTKLIPRKNA